MKTTNLYYINKDRLSLLPQMFTGMVIVGIFLVTLVVLNSFFYIEVIAENIPFFKTSVNYQDPESLLAAEETVILENKLLTKESPEGLEVTANCHLKQASQVPPGIIPVVERGTIWWEPSVCNLDIKGLQIVNRPVSDFQLDTTDSTYKIEVTKENQFAIVYGSIQPEAINLDEISQTSQELEGNQSFALTVDSQRIGSQRITLVGDCSQSGDSCQLWVSEAFSGTSNQVYRQVTSITYQGKNLMEDYNYVQIARTQDEFPEVINLIYRNSFGEDMVFVRIDSETGNILQRLLINPEEKEIYNRFYR